MAMHDTEDDWDRSLSVENTDAASPTTPRTANSVAFPTSTSTPGRTSQYSSALDGDSATQGTRGQQGNRTLSDLLRLHSEKGTNSSVTPEEASRIADVLGQWINASSSPYEGEDDFFARSQDDSRLASKRPLPIQLTLVNRPRGRSESASSLKSRSANTPTTSS